MITATDLADKIVATARQFDGACACPAHRQSIYDAVGMVFDPRPFRVENGKVIGMSTCYIFALNVLRLSGIALMPWYCGEPIGRLEVWAQQHGCWQSPINGAQPGPGDVLIVGPRGGTHVELVTGCDGATIDTIEGGKCCRRKTDGHDGLGRQMIASRSQIWWGDRAGGDLVVGWVVCGLAPMQPGQ